MLDKTKYDEKCFFIINTKKFKKLDKNPVVSYEAKCNASWGRGFTFQDYDNRITGSNAGKLYGTARIQKLPKLRIVDQLPRSIVPNIGTVSYYIVKHLGKILATFSKSEYIVPNTKDFINFNKPNKIPSNFQLIWLCFVVH